MVIAYILIISESGAERRIVDNLLDIDGVEEAELVYGDYDVIAKVSVEDISQLSDFILEKIRPISSIKRTSTLIVAGD
ncbi:MAG: Lrp/AsnC ligand binding domain-containing protein [archaeon]